MTPSRKNVVWFGGGHWCDLGVVKPSIAGCGRIILFLLEPVASLGRELWLTFWDFNEPLILARVTLLASLSLFVFGHLGVLIICFFFGLWADR